MMLHHFDERKVLIYARRGTLLLVFDEPEHPEVELQVPGGTVEPDETLAGAAKREFEEETGLALTAQLLPLGIGEHIYRHEARTVRHERHGFAFDLDASAPMQGTWLHRELQPSQGEPALFRFFWLEIGEAKRRLGYGMEAMLEHRFFEPRRAAAGR